MNPTSWFGAGGDSGLKVLWEDGERVFCRRESQANGDRAVMLAVLPAAEHPTPAILDRLAHEYGLKDELDGAWAVRPLELLRERGRIMLVLEETSSEPLGRLLEAPMEVPGFLRIAISVAAALTQVHRRGLVHKDIKPANILVNHMTGEVKLTGFGIASRLPRERQAPAPPESIAGTLAYMAPEQTGRMNRSIDARSDLYALGVTLYQMLTGSLPFTATEPMEWVHCHIARKPVPPSERLETIPAAISAVILKLLAKSAEERYQTAAGLERDLRRCLAAWQAQHRIDAFRLGQQDTSDRLLIPEKLYGREREIETLLAAFDRVVTSGRPELVLVSGYSGIGKSAVVNELHKALVPPRGLFASGKFDQYKRDIPYATLAQAFQSLIRSLLGKSEAELAGWRDALREALDPNGRLVIDVVPELKLLIGEQPPVQELSPQQAQGRLQLVFRRFLGVFARPEHPLALFLDDLQWLDAATLDMLADLLTQADVQQLLVIGAYRDNEVDADHPLMRRLDTIRKAGAMVQEISLAPLAREDLKRLVADTLSCEPGRAAPLARLVHEKTGGNPFFAIQFISALAEEGLLHFDHDAARWRWELDRLHAKGHTDNVVSLMVGRLARLPVETQAALQQLACLGNVADITVLSIILGKSNEDVRSDLWEAVRLELVEHQEGSYRFTHDRVQEAAYSLIPERLRAEAHLLIGRLLALHTPAEKREEAIFEIVNQLNRGANLITSREEREQLAEFNLLAGQRAKATTAYASALTYLTAGEALLPENAWERGHELTFALSLHRGECEFLTGALAEAEQRLAALSSRAANTMERATVACLRADLYTTLDQGSRAIAVGLDYLRHLGIDWSPHPTEEEARREYERIWSLLGGRTIESLIELPLMTDPASLATLDVLAKIGPPSFYTDANLLGLIACRVVNLSLERGNCDASCSGYVWVSMVAGPIFGDYRTAVYRFGQLGYDLVEGRGLTRFQARTYMDFGNCVLPWTRHVRAGRDVVRRAFEAAIKVGDLTCATSCGNQMNTNLLTAGDPLAEAKREVERGLAFAQKVGFGTVVDVIAVQLGVIRTLRGLTPKFGSFDDEQFDERRIEGRFSENPELAIAECWYWIRKLQARFFAGDYVSAIEASSRAHGLLWTSTSMLETAEYHFYGALSQAASCDSAAAGEPQQWYLDAIAAHHKQLKLWAANCPDNFENRAALVGAELARLEGRDVEAMRLYEQAIRSARGNGFIHQEALANELASRFYAARGFERIARVYLQDARYSYLRWGADGKVRQLDEMYPNLREQEPAPAPTSTIGAPVEHLDLATVIKVSQAVSSEIVLEELIDTLLRTAVAQAGAERGLLIVTHGAEPRIEAEATTGGDTVAVQLRDQPVTSAVLPESVLHYVVRTRESVILDDASAQSPFAADPYLRQRQARSVLCVPLVKQSKLIGVLYLENNLASHVFTPARISVLELLASQAAISLENAHLYNDLQEREARIRRLVDANIVGIVIWDVQGRIIEANQAFLDMVGYAREDVVSGRLRWIELTPAEWRDADNQILAELKVVGTVQPREKEYFRKDGSRVPVLVARALFEWKADEGVAFIIDMTDRKRGEEKLRASEQRLLEAQMALAHANRVTTMGQLTASIAHEVKQPIGAIVTNAQAGLRFLGAEVVDMNELQEILRDIVKDGNRAGEVINRISDLIKKARPRRDNLEINGAIREVIEFTRGEAVKNRVSVHTELADRLSLVRGDRVELQQVILNLVMNGIEAMQSVEDRPRELVIRSVQDETQQVRVSVTDCGIGFSAENADRLFTAFFTTKSSGMGMGLSICRSIIEAHDGRLWAAANAPHGAIFQFTLPVNSDATSMNLGL
jgi:PAS domain S-box-containing protein